MREWLRKARISRGLKGYQVAKMAKISPAYYTLIERGIRTPSTSIAQLIAAVLRVEWTKFYESEGNNEKKD